MRGQYGPAEGYRLAAYDFSSTIREPSRSLIRRFTSLSDTLTSYLTSTVSQSNAGATDNSTLTATTTLTDSSSDTLGGPTTLTQTESISIGADGTIASGWTGGTLWSSGTDTYNLNETSNETYSSAGNGKQPGAAGVESLAASNSYSGSCAATSSSVAIGAVSATQTSTMSLGNDGVISGGSSTDWSYENGSDSSTSSATGTNVRQFAFTGGASDSATYSTTFSSSGQSGDTLSHTHWSALTYGGNGVILNGSETDTVSASGPGSFSYSEYGSRSISWDSGWDEGSYSGTLSDGTAFFEN
jgi:fibronectin-binding autotransporter adhesin